MPLSKGRQRSKPEFAPYQCVSAALTCLPWDISCQIDSFFAGIDTSIIQSMLGAIGSTELTTPDVTTAPGVQAMSLAVLGVADGLFEFIEPEWLPEESSVVAERPRLQDDDTR